MTDDITGGGREEPGSQWYDNEAGPLVRPYAMTGGRTRPGPDGSTVRPDRPRHARSRRTGRRRHRARAGTPPLIDLCRTETQSVAELAADADLPVGVIRVLLGDLMELGCVTVSRPVPPAQLPDERILREVIDGLRAL
ncbi:hypothetical protein STENM327S_00159 [Streptomyces tendae]